MSLTTGAGYDVGALPLKDLASQDGEVRFVKEGDEVRLRATRSRSSQVICFPETEICPETGARDMELVETESRGLLYSHSTIHVSATRETPYTVGYVDFPNGLRVLARVRWPDEPLEGCDLPVKLAADDQEWWVEPLEPKEANS